VTNNSTTTQAVIARLIRALSEVALCESWLALDEARRDLHHQAYANAANDRALELSREASDG
jgi:hypothetical protein